MHYLHDIARLLINLTDWSKFAYVWGTFSAIATFSTLLIGGIWALKRYHREIRLQAADLLLKMEDEYRQVLPTCFDFEDPCRYETVLLPALKKDQGHAALDEAETKTLLALDRCLRFFFLCTVLNADLKVEETAIARAYYYYICVLAEPDKREELQSYVRTYYKRLSQWMNRHRDCLNGYRETGDWDPRLVAKLEPTFMSISKVVHPPHNHTPAQDRGE